MKIFHVSYSDVGGGAARAAYRIHHALRIKGVDSTMMVSNAAAGDWTVQGPVSKLEKLSTRIRLQVAWLASRLLRTENPIIHSPALLPSGLIKRLQACDADVVHLHWINGEMLSIPEIGRISKPVVWTLHDMWAFCGAEHLAWDDRWREGYRANNRPIHETGFDLNRWAWVRKRKHWRRPMLIVTPSRWLARCVRESALMGDWPVEAIPNPIDTEIWQPLEQKLARTLLGLPIGVPLMLFGAIGGTAAYHKGFDLLLDALELLQGEVKGLELVVFGQLRPEVPPNLGFPIHYMGHLHDDLSLRALYSAVNLMALPSRQDNLPNTGVEAHACGIPVVAFDTGGLPDIIDHQKTGYLAKAFDPEDFAAGVKWVLSDAVRLKALGLAARDRAERLWSVDVVASQYLKIYQRALERSPA